jgi:menaquinone-9 beta-reductase
VPLKSSVKYGYRHGCEYFNDKILGIIYQILRGYFTFVLNKTKTFMTIFETPVCVVGAGPAGSTASLFLSKYGIPHILVDRETFPRDKVCGEQFSGRATHVLREIDPQLESELVAKKILLRSWSLDFTFQPQNKVITYRFDETKSPILKAKRSEFDNYLFQKAKQSPLASCFENVYLTTYENTEGGVLIQDKNKTMQIKAQLVLFCTGEKIPFFKKIFGEKYKDKGSDLLFLRRYYRMPSFRKINPKSEFHLIQKPIVHLILHYELANGLIMIEIGTSKTYMKDSDMSIEEVFDYTVENVPRLKELLFEAELVQKSRGTSMLLGTIPRLLSAERFLLAGSALGSINPITGFGVGHAMRSAQIAAYWAAKSVEVQDFSPSFLKQYDAQIKKRMNADFKVGYFFNWAFNNIKWLIPILNLFIFTDIFAKFMANIDVILDPDKRRVYFKKMFKIRNTQQAIDN